MRLGPSVAFATSRRMLFSLHFRSRKHVSRRANCRMSARVCCYLHAWYLSAGNRGCNFVSMGIVWQQVGKISTHRLPTAVSRPWPLSAHRIALHGNAISFSPAIFRPAFRCRECRRRTNLRFPRELHHAGNRWGFAKQYAIRCAIKNWIIQWKYMKE